MKWQVAALLLLCTLGTHSALRAQEPRLVVVVNKTNPTETLSLGDLRRIFTKQTRVWSTGETVVPVDWDATSDFRRYFSEKVLGRSVREMTEFWVQQNITEGLTPPSTQKSSRAILRFVASVPGAVSYVPASDVDETVKRVSVSGLQ